MSDFTLLKAIYCTTYLLTLLPRGEGIWRFSHSRLMHGQAVSHVNGKTTCNDHWTKAISERFLQFTEEEAKTIQFQKNSSIIWDNWRFFSQYMLSNDPNIYLQQIWLR